MAALGSSTYGAAQGDNVDLFNGDNFSGYATYFTRDTATTRKTKWVWANLLGTGGKWETNMGPIKRVVRTQMGALGRQSATGWVPLATQEPTIDRHSIGESTRDVQLDWKDFESPYIQWRQDFFKLITDSIEPNRKNLEIQMGRDLDLYYRDHVLNYSPFVYVCGLGLVSTIPSFSDSVKTRPWWIEQLTQCTEALTVKNLAKVLNQAQEVLGIPPNEGDSLAVDGKGFTGKYKLLTDGTTMLSWTDDPWVQSLKDLQRDLLNGTFQGAIFGRVAPIMEQMPKRLASTATVAGGTFEHPPELVAAADAYDGGEPIPNPDYGNIATSPWQVSWLMGPSKEAYKAMSVQPPPAAFTKNSPTMLPWNGKLELRKPTIIKVLDSNGAVQYRGNEKGRTVQLMGTLAAGLEPNKNRWILPIIHKRAIFNANLVA